MGRPPIKSTKALVKAELQAKAEWKATKKGWDSSLRDHLGMMIDRVDPLKLAAAAGLTFVIHDLIVNTEELSGAISLMGFKLPLDAESAIYDVYNAWKLVFTGGDFTDDQIKTIQDQLQKDDWKLWLISFGIAYFLIENGASILNSASGIVGAIGGFLGLGVVAA